MDKHLEADGIPVYCAFDELASTETLIGNPHNPNTHPAKQVELLAKIIAAQGWRAPITVSTRSGFVVRGHGRLLAARLLGKTEVPVDRQDYETEAAEWADMIADNRIAELAELDLPLLGDLLLELDDGSFDMDLTGFQSMDLERLLSSVGGSEAVEDEAPEPPKNPVTKPGDLWLLGEHRLLCGDSTKAEDVNRLMNGNPACCLWTDPPYGVNYVGGTSDALTVANDTPEGLETLLREAFSLAGSVLLPGSPFYIAHPAGPLSLVFENLVATLGWRHHQSLVWVKDSLVLGHSDYHFRHEPLLYGWTTGEGRSGRGDHPGSRWYGGHDQTSVFEIPRPKRSAEHPTMKPVELVARCLTNSTPRKGLIYDPFLGSGTTLIAAEHLGRVCYGMELSPAYADVIVKRWENLTNGKAVLG